MLNKIVNFKEEVGRFVAVSPSINLLISISVNFNLHKFRTVEKANFAFLVLGLIESRPEED